MAERGAARVLVVEDSQTIQQFLSRVLVNGGMTVTTAGDGESAVRYFMADRPDCVLLDVNLPGWTAGGCSRSCGRSTRACPS